MTPILRISTDERFATALEYIKKRLDLPAVDVCLQSAKDARTCLVVSVDYAAVPLVRKIAAAALDALAEVIVTDCKAHFIQNRLKLPIENEVNKYAFIKALSTFDRETDKIIAKNLVKLTPDFLLDSFYDFMATDLKARWLEVCELANENICYLVCGKTFSELLRFLISNIESSVAEAHVVVSGTAGRGRIEVLGDGMKPINSVYINESLPQDIQVVTKLVAIAPKKIYLHEDSEDAFGEALMNSIQNLFGNCVHIVDSRPSVSR